MDLALSDEQTAFIASLRRMLSSLCTTEVVRQAATPNGTGHSDEVWKGLLQAGCLSMAFPESFGGANASLFDLGLAYRELGRALVPTTFNSTITAGMLFANVGTDEQKEEWLVRLCNGDFIGTVALSEPNVHEKFELIETVARRQGDGWVLNGQKSFVANANTAECMIVLARLNDNLDGSRFGLFIVPCRNGGISIDPYLTFGQDALHEVKFDECVLTHDSLLGGPDSIGSWRSLCSASLDRVRALRCMEMLGGIEAVLDQTVEYVTDRYQFGVPIGSFQAVQHHLANVAMRLEAGRIAAFRAMSLASQSPTSCRQTIIAELWLRDTYVQATLIAHQVWGGAGYSLDGDLYLWTQRAKTLDLVCGRKDLQFDQLLADNLELQTTSLAKSTS